MKAVILAGGKGTRLKPYTTVFPKPLMPIGDKPILEIVVRQLKSHGFDEIIITVGHLAELIMTFFGDGSKVGVKIKYSREDKPLGTAGGLGLIKKALNETFLMMNGDVLTTLDYSDLVNYHKKKWSLLDRYREMIEKLVEWDFDFLTIEDAFKQANKKGNLFNLVGRAINMGMAPIYYLIKNHNFKSVLSVR